MGSGGVIFGGSLFFGFVYFLPKHDKIYLYTHTESIFYTDYPFYTRFGRINVLCILDLLRFTIQNKVRQVRATHLYNAHEFVWWTGEREIRELLTKRVFGICSRNEFHETSFYPLLTKRVLTKPVFTKRVFWHCSRNECSRNECSRNELLASANETSFTKRVFWLCSRNDCSRNECSRNEFWSTAHETSAHETSAHETNLNSWAQNFFIPTRGFMQQSHLSELGLSSPL